MAPPLGSRMNLFLLAIPFVASSTVSLLLLRSSLLLTLSLDPTARSTATDMVVDLCPRWQTPRVWETLIEETSPSFNKVHCVVLVRLSAQGSFGELLEQLCAFRFADGKRRS